MPIVRKMPTTGVTIRKNKYELPQIAANNNKVRISFVFICYHFVPANLMASAGGIVIQFAASFILFEQLRVTITYQDKVFFLPKVSVPIVNPSLEIYGYT